MGSALWIGALTQGLIYGFLAWGVMISLRGLRFADITVDGSLTTGAAVAASLALSGVHPALSTLAALFAGAIAGTVTGILHTRFGIDDLLSGILTMTALYSVNLHIMGRSNLALTTDLTLVGGMGGVGTTDLSWLTLAIGLGIAGCIGLLWFLRTDFGMALRATGDNAAMVTAQGIDPLRMKVFGLAFANGLVGVAGALVAQYQGFADISMGIGSLVGAIASLIIGETLLGQLSARWLVIGAVVGSILYRSLIALALQSGLNPIDLKIATAGFVFLALAVPYVHRSLARKRARRTA